ncbi:unnamed protein product [Didymodactylos carnosus]|uniref:Putative hydroxypyruvate isomerase n=1 Tax=Didymodactylos carnosus TaxID=1234261 RepID=A0A814NI28_9BILA|nr:unnamed protein product [Didymodactylos carnosus]CAF1092548.1 unnamed protein product [Didymodactylos carnosus]CAF3675091.1 unnamed protein product [Didymodactylos carnosus]CAF3857976.1 unnamed protein product [Didymodactylos carnosus]
MMGSETVEKADLRIRKDYRFDAVECQNPYEFTIDQWKKVFNEEKRPKWVLINSPPLFDQPQTISTFDQYRQHILDKTLDYAKELKISKVHLVMNDVSNSSQIPSVVNLLKLAAQYFAPHNIMCLIEPLSTRSDYYLRSYYLAADIVREAKQSNLKVMLDSFHLQRLHGNLTENIELLAPFVGHVQISQTPLRDCPMNNGEVNHKYFLQKIATFYHDYIGLEYICVNFALIIDILGTMFVYMKLLKFK